MNNNYILRHENSVTAFYYRDKKILCRKYENGRFGEVKTVLDNALKNFTVSLEGGKEATLYCRDGAGNIILIACKDDNFSKKVLLENKSDEIQNLLFYPVNKNGINLIYNIPGEQKRYKLLAQSLSESGSWLKPVEIDGLLPYKDSLFYVQPLGKSILVCYVNAAGSLGYREISEAGHGEFVPISANSENITDYNVFSTKNALHFLYVTANMFGSRLMYKKKEGESFTKPQIIWEGQRPDNCLLWIHNNILCAGFMAPGGLYIKRSVNGGASFSPPEIYKNKFCKNPVKAVYLSGPEMDEGDFYLREVFVDSHNPWDIQIMPDLCQSFYPKPKAEPVVINEAPPKRVESPKDSMILERLSALSAENQELRFKYAKAVEALNENSSVNEVSKANLAKERSLLETQIEILRNKISALEAENMGLAAENTRLSAALSSQQNFTAIEPIEPQSDII